ncbi:AEC family transporter [Haloarcula japonica]|uniref:Malonate transporter n=1 Tax=Haloarcula japonica (strain ATCC 49778 / DSM 6131 / JCM 7785 / NBRC 101032 / NCIMB 13157 / TR-1) TaxID=1227453 RepID=M0L767_HALJT|nr:AEC family transporter [Haloarcula japonica]EMA28933.1 malonate transporter [Haloarcula japonica DSM 6131]
MGVLGQLGFMITFLSVGVAAGHLGLLTERRTDILTTLVFTVALPALIFRSTYDRPLREIISPALLGGFWTVIVLTVLLGWLVHRRLESASRRSVSVVQSYHSNMGFLGLPLVAETMGSDATAVASVILGIGALTHVPVTVFLLVRINGSDASLLGECKKLLTNPVLIALGAGIAASVLSVSVPETLVRALALPAELALPVALLCIGATLDTDLPLSDVQETASVVGLKVLWMPALAWLVYSSLSMDATALGAAVVMFGAPTAVSTYVYTTELGGDAAFASLNVFTSTVASIGTLSVLIWLFG